MLLCTHLCENTVDTHEDPVSLAVGLGSAVSGYAESPISDLSNMIELSMKHGDLIYGVRTT